MRSALKHIILLCTMLLFGCGSLSANTFSATSFTTSEFSAKENLAKIISEHSSDSEVTISFPAKELYTKRAIVDDIEEENSENFSSKKNLEKSNFLASLFSHQTSNLLAHISDNYFSYYRGFSNLNSYNPLYILFGVFRI